MDINLKDLRPRQLVAPPLEETGMIPDGKRHELFLDYMQDPEATPDSLSSKHDLSLTEVLFLFRDGRWVQTKYELQRASQEASDLVYAGMVAKERPTVGSEQLVLGKHIENAVMRTIEASMDEALSPSKLKQLAEAAAAAVKIRATVVGLTEKVAADSVAKAQAANPQIRAALLVIGAKPIGKSPVDITAEVKEMNNEAGI